LRLRRTDTATMRPAESETNVRTTQVGASINGTGRVALAPAVAGSPYDDPMSRVLGLDSQASGTIRWVAYFLGALALMQGFVVTAHAIAQIVAMDAKAPPSQVLQEIQVIREEPPPPPPAAPEPAKPEPAPPPRAIPHEPPPPPPAQAGKVLTQEPDPNEPVDLTGNTIVTGNAEEYAGGVTTSNGTSQVAVRAANAAGAPGNTGNAQAPPAPAGPDLSRPPAVTGSSEWTVPWPMEADTLQIDEALVSLQIGVRPDGSAAEVRVLGDPGNGFGRDARRYALNQHFQPALDHSGRPVAGTFRVRVHFSR
jgi:protein TonB